MANIPSPPNAVDIINDINSQFFVGLYTNSPGYDTWNTGSTFVQPGDPSYHDQSTWPSSIDEDAEAEDGVFDVVQFDGSNYLSAQVVNGFYLYASYADGTIILGFQNFPQPLTLGPGLPPIEVSASVDAGDLTATVPVNNA